MALNDSIIEIEDQISVDRYYCLGYLVTNGPDGMIDVSSSAFAERKRDHMKQNESNISGRLVDSQVGNLQLFDTSTDKGMIFI